MIDPDKPPPGSPMDEAAAWLDRRAGGADLSREPEFTAWEARSPESSAAWAEAERVWTSFDVEPDMLLAAMRRVAIETHTVANDDDGDTPPVWRRWAVGWGMAAAVLLGIGVARQQGLFGSVASPTAVATTRFESVRGGRRTVRLDDGSSVTLASGSVIAVRFPPGRREVALERGQAYFAVAHDSIRPFTVTAGGGRVTDIGTAFDLLARNDGMRVVVAKGRVALTERGTTQTLSAGEAFDTSPATRGRLRAPDLAALLAWREGYLEFRAEPLAAAIADMNRYSRQKIVIADTVAAALPVSGRFSTGDSERFARSIADLYGLSISHAVDGSLEIRGSAR